MLLPLACCRWWWLLSVELTKQLSSFTVLQLPTSVLLCPGLLLSYSLTDLAALGLFIFISEFTNTNRLLAYPLKDVPPPPIEQTFRPFKKLWPQNESKRNEVNREENLPKVNKANKPKSCHSPVEMIWVKRGLGAQGK